MWWSVQQTVERENKVSKTAIEINPLHKSFQDTYLGIERDRKKERRREIHTHTKREGGREREREIAGRKTGQKLPRARTPALAHASAQ